jgi:hypothetical protein
VAIAADGNTASALDHFTINKMQLVDLSFAHVCIMIRTPSGTAQRYGRQISGKTNAHEK